MPAGLLPLPLVLLRENPPRKKQNLEFRIFAPHDQAHHMAKVVVESRSRRAVLSFDVSDIGIFRTSKRAAKKHMLITAVMSVMSVMSMSRGWMTGGTIGREIVITAGRA